MFSINAPTASANTKLWIAGLVTLIISKATRSRSVDPKGRKNAERMIPFLSLRSSNRGCSIFQAVYPPEPVPARLIASSFQMS
jgi:hypothetical protein